VRIATWNVNSIKARLPFVLHWLDARKPDVVALQELKVAEDKFPFAALEAAGYHATLHAQKAWNGVAVLSRNPATKTQGGLPGAEDAGARLVTVEVDGLSMTSVYVPNGKTVSHDDYQVKLSFMDALVRYAETMVATGQRVVIGGDYNICPADADSHDPAGSAGHIFHTDQERARITRLLGLGLVDLYREAEPDGDMFSWWDYRAGAFHKNKGLRIDLLLATPVVREAVTNVWIDRDYRKKKEGETPSDHAPVIAELRD
jgi:exodeoxyribonuclease III